MKFKKAAALFMATAMCAGALAGCGTKDSSSSSSSAGGQTSGTDEDEAITTTITVWGPSEDQSADYGEWLQTTCEKFNKEHPNWNITFKYGTCSEADAGKLVTDDPSASADVYMFANDQLQKLIDAGAIAKLGGETAKYVSSTNSEAIVSSVTVDGAIYGVPFTTNTWSMYYNKSIFSEDDIKSLESMLAKGKVAFPLTDAWYNASFFAANGCTLFGDGTDNDAGIDFTGEKAVQATEYMINLVANPNFVNDADSAGMAGMADGSIGAMFTGSWNYGSLKEKLGDNLGVAQLPTINIGGEDKSLLSFAGSKAIGVNPNCEYQQIAVALALYLGNADSQLSHYEARSIVPCNTELLSQEPIKSDDLVLGTNATFDNTSILQPVVSGMNDYWTPAADFAKAIINGEVTLDNAEQKTADYNNSVNTSLAD